MEFVIKKATRSADARGRVALIGPSGAGKTWKALAIASVLGRRADGTPGRIIVIDTERGSASKYAQEPELRVDFDVIELDTFAPATYVGAIRACENAGADVVIIDSLSHAWMGKDGALEMVDKISAQSQSRNNFDAWRKVTPEHTKLVDALLRCKAHLVVTMRVKTEYVVEEDSRGKKVPRKIGLAPVQRDSLEYEFDVVGDVNQDHQIVVTKSRCSALADAVVSKEDIFTAAHTYRAWLVEAPVVAQPPSEGHDQAGAPGTETEKPASGPTPVELDAFLGRVREIELPGEAVAVWVKHRASLGPLCAMDRESAWRALCKKTEEVGKMKNAKVWLKKAIAEEDARHRPEPPPNGTDGGAGSAGGGTPASGQGGSAATSTSEATRNSIARMPGVPEWATTREAIEAHLASLDARAHLENSVRLHGARLGDAYQKPAAQRLIALSPLDSLSSTLAEASALAQVKAWSVAGPRAQKAVR